MTTEYEIIVRDALKDEFRLKIVVRPSHAGVIFRRASAHGHDVYLDQAMLRRLAHTLLHIADEIDPDDNPKVFTIEASTVAL